MRFIILTSVIKQRHTILHRYDKQQYLFKYFKVYFVFSSSAAHSQNKVRSQKRLSVMG